LQPRQVNLFRGGPSLTLNLSITFLARAACRLASSMSVRASSTEDSVRSLAIAAASSLAPLLCFTGAGWGQKELTLPVRPPHVKLQFILAESALETVPREIGRSPAVLSDSRRRGIDPSRILLDRSFHHSAMTKLKDGEKRGRPDLVHAALLSLTGTPLFLDGQMKVYVHTSQDLVLELGEGTRIPKSYLRFRGLAEKLLVEMPREGLVKAYPASMANLVRKIVSPDLTIGLSTQGVPSSAEELAAGVQDSRKPCLVVGGFPHGHFSPETLRLTDRLVRISPRPLEAHVVAARVVYEVEKVTGRMND